ncbi:MAG: tyrosine-type recombinase/integrase, partial [Pseudomonadota bacterium]
DFTIHDLRHTFCSRLAQAGLSLQEIALLSGHQNLQTVQIYAHLIPTDVSKKGAEILNIINKEGGAMNTS